MLKREFRSWCVDDRADAGQVTIGHFVKVMDVFDATVAANIDHWDDFHIYSPRLIRQRLDYKPDRPLYVLLTRVYRLPAPAQFFETPAYAGCRTWVTLTEAVDTTAGLPVLDQDTFSTLRNQMGKVFRSARLTD